jgi:formylglycine-generating enzyme required for sulfatase activity
VVRGGSFLDVEEDCSVSSRDCENPNERNRSLGFRLAISQD